MFNSIKKYTAEFLILFLAVFMGALAENFREDYQEQRQGKELMKRFYRDLQSDLVIIESTIWNLQNKINTIGVYDTLRLQIPESPQDFIHRYHLLRDANIWNTFIYIPNTITIDQIKSTGAWDFIPQKHADMVSGYQIAVNILKESAKLQEEDIRETFDLIKKLPRSAAGLNESDFDQKELKVVYNYVHNLYWSHISYIQMLTKHKYFIKDLLGELEGTLNINSKIGKYESSSRQISVVKVTKFDGIKEYFLIQDVQDSLKWHSELELDSGSYIFRRGADWDISWGADTTHKMDAYSGKARLRNSILASQIKIKAGKYRVEFDLNDTTYSINPMD